MTAVGFGPDLKSLPGMVDFLSVVSLSLLIGLLTFSAAVSFLSRCFISATILSVAATTILALEIATSISLINS